MKKLLKVLLFLVLLLVAFVAYTLSSTGYFRTIEPHFEGDVVQKIEVVGAEDMTIARDGKFLLISSDDRASRKKGNPKQGGIYWMDLEEAGKAPFEVKLISQDFKKPFFPHGFSLLQLDSANYKLWVINHVEGKHSIEVFRLRGDSLTYVETLKDEKMISPNDILAVGENEFYFTNDHVYMSKMGTLAEGYLGLKAANVVHFNGEEHKLAAEGIAYANGINWDAERQLLYVASARGFLVKVYKVETDGSLTFVEDIDCETGVDNIEVDEQGDLWIGAHPSLMAYTAYANFEEDIAPSEVLKLNYRGRGDYTLQSLYINDGSQVSGSSVAVNYSDYLFVGNVMDEYFLVLEMKSEEM